MAQAAVRPLCAPPKGDPVSSCAWIIRAAAMVEASVISFAVAHEGANSKGKPTKSYTLRSGADSVVRIGRAPGNDVVVDHRGASQYHAELRFLPDDAGVRRLHIRDISMNGTGLKTVDDKTAVHLRKSTDTVLPDGSTLLVPMLLKAALTENDRTWLKVMYQDTPVQVQEQGSKRQRAREDTPQATQPTPASGGQAAAREGSASEQDEDKDAEKSRMQFVELLLKTREVCAGTTYEDARRMLASEPAWDAVDETTRRECFEIFVEHLGNHNSKKGKKKEKGKSKKEKRRHNEEEAAPQKDAAPEASRGKRRKEEKKGGSGSPDRHRKSKREKKGRERSRGRSGGGDGSRSHSRQKKRRRDRSGSA
uniref:FHA domain-containing protein n=1 Tax=Alexandrium monilatum TaxID=311494 RepID=A0A7S4V633_9DINO